MIYMKENVVGRQGLEPRTKGYGALSMQCLVSPFSLHTRFLH
jgi:hypothetical protein